MTGYIFVNNVNEFCVMDRGGKGLLVKSCMKGSQLMLLCCG